MQEEFKVWSKRFKKRGKGGMYDLEMQTLLLKLKEIFYEQNHVSMFKLRECKMPEVSDILIDRLCKRYFVQPRYR